MKEQEENVGKKEKIEGKRIGRREGEEDRDRDTHRETDWWR